MLGISGDTRHTFVTEAISGAGAKTVAIAGSVALNLIDSTTEARINSSATVGGLNNVSDITVTATSNTSSASKAKPNDDGATVDTVGIGASLALNRLDHQVSAVIDNSVVFVGTGRNFNVAANANHIAATESTAGGNNTNGIAGSVALAIIVNTTLASFGTGGAVTLTGTGDVRATHTRVSAAKADATVTGSNVGIGVGASINDDEETSSAFLSRSLTLAGALNVLSTSSATSTIDTKSTAKGADSQSGTPDQNTNKQRNQTPNTGSVSTLPSGISAMTSGNSSSNSNSSSKGGSLDVAASIGVNVLNVTNTATIESGSVLRGGGVTLEAITPSGQANSFVIWGAAAAGGTGGVGVAGSIAIEQVNFTTLASAKTGSQLLSTGNLTVNATDALNPQTLAVGAGFNASNNPVVGGSVALRLMTSQTDAFIGGSADAAGAISVTARTTINPTVIDLPGPLPDPTATSVAVAGSASTGGVGVAGAVVINIDTINTSAMIGNGAAINQNSTIRGVSNQSITVTAIDAITMTSLAGSLTIAPSSIGVGAGLDLAIIEKHTTTSIGRSVVVSSKSNVTIETTSTDVFKTLSINAGIGNSAGIAGSASVYDVTSNSIAKIDSAAGAASTLNATGAVRVASTGNFTLTSLAGSVGAAGTAGIGAANVTLTHTDNVQAYTGENANITSNGGAGLAVSVSSREDVIGIAAAGGGAETAGVAGSATAVILDESSQAWIGRNNFIQANVSKLTKKTTAFIDSGATIDVEGNLFVTADSSEDITSVAAGLAASGTASVAADAGVHVLDMTTRAWIGDDPRDAVASPGADSIVVNGSVVASADDRTEIDKVVGVLAASLAGLGAAAGVFTSNKLTEAFLSAGLNITALGNIAASNVPTGGFVLGTTGSSALTTGIEPGTASLTVSPSSLSATGEVGLPRVGSMDVDRNGSNDTNENSITGQQLSRLPLSRRCQLRYRPT